MDKWVKRVESNVKGGVTLDLPGTKVLLVGTNGSGKSSVTQSVELATTGSVTDVLGRARLSKPIDLLMLAPGRVGPLHSRVVFNDGTESNYTVNGTTAKSTGASLTLAPWMVQKTPEDHFPLWGVREALLGSADTTRKFFVGFTGELRPEDVIEKLGDKRLVELYRAATAQSLIKDSATTKILMGVAFAKKKISEGKEKANVKMEAAVEVGRSLGTPPSAEEMKEAQRQAVEARARLEQERANESAMARLTDELKRLSDYYEQGATEIVALQEEIAALRQEINLGENKLKRAKVAWDNARIPDADVKLTEALLVVYGYMVENNLSMSLPSGDPISMDVVVAARDATQLSLYETRSLRAALIEAEAILASLTEARSSKELVLTTLNERGAKFEARAIEIDTKMSEIGGSDVPGAQTALAAAEAKVSRLNAEQAQWKVSEKVASASIDDKLEAARWEALRDALQRILNEQMKAGVGAFSQRIQSRLLPDDRFQLNLVDGEREVCQYGFMRNDVLHTALSGGEWSRLTVAMASACMNEALPWRCIVPEDRSWGGHALAGVMESFTPMDAQIIMTACAFPSRVPAGWHVLRVGA